MKFLTRLPVTNDLQAFTADIRVRGRVGTAAGRGQPQLGAEPTSRTDTRVPRRTGPRSQQHRCGCGRPVDTHTLVSKCGESRGLQPPHELVVSTKSFSPLSVRMHKNVKKLLGSAPGVRLAASPADRSPRGPESFGVKNNGLWSKKKSRQREEKQLPRDHRPVAELAFADRVQVRRHYAKSPLLLLIGWWWRPNGKLSRWQTPTPRCNPLPTCTSRPCTVPRCSSVGMEINL